MSESTEWFERDGCDECGDRWQLSANVIDSGILLRLIQGFKRNALHEYDVVQAKRLRDSLTEAIAFIEKDRAGRDSLSTRRT